MLQNGESIFFVSAFMYQTSKVMQLYRSDLERVLDILEEKGYARADLRLKTIGIDFEIAQKQAIDDVGFVAVFDVMHLRRRWWKKFVELGGKLIHNTLKKSKVDNWFGSFQESFTLPLVHPDLVPSGNNSKRPK